MSAKTPYYITKGEVRGLYGCGFHWWVENPGRYVMDRRPGRGGPRVYLRFQGIHNKADVGNGFSGLQAHAVLLGKNGYLRRLWRNGLENAVESAVATLDVDEKITPAEGLVRCIWTPYDSLAQALDDPAAAAWRGYEKLAMQLAMQLDLATPVLERQRDVKVFLVRFKSLRRFSENADGHSITSASLLLFDPWQWTSFHAALYSLCTPFMDDAPVGDLCSMICEKADRRRHSA